MSITITVPNDDHVALRAMAKALEEIAVARNAPVQGKHIGEMKYKIHLDMTQATAALEQLVKQPEIDTTAQQVESLVDASKTFTPSNEYQPTKEGENRLSSVVLYDTQTKQTEHLDVTEQAPPTTDSTGTPWDERIHSASKALNGDGTWRVRRKPADKTPEEWVEYIKWVEEDIHLVESLHPEDNEYSADGLIVSVASASPDVDAYAVPEKDFTEVTGFAEAEVTPAGDDFHVDAGVVTEQEVASIPAPPLPVPPTVAKDFSPDIHKGIDKALNAIAAPAPSVTDLTFPQVMQFLTERHGRITSAQVYQIIADMGLKSIMDLNTQPEHTGQFIERVKALLGE